MPKLLIVDDEEATLDMLSTYLSLIGHETISAVNGNDGLNKAQAEKPDLMLLDLMMPDLQGYEVCSNLRTQSDYGSLPILIISARTDQGSIDKAMSSGADGYFTKPIDLPLLTKEIERLLANPPRHLVDGKAVTSVNSDAQSPADSTATDVKASNPTPVKPPAPQSSAPEKTDTTPPVSSADADNKPTPNT